ncbi:MAG TPA: hypothetical protein VGE77_08430, partial [Nocardioides sp.]
MTSSDVASWWRALLVAGGAFALLLAVVALAAPGGAPLGELLRTGGTTASYDALLVALASAAVLVAAPWCWLLVVLVLVDALR